MALQKSTGGPQVQSSPEGITRMTVGGFKSIAQEQSIDIRPLTILAGANSSGKSSMIQPLLLLKQTIEAPFEPATLLLNGPNVKFTFFDQLLSRKQGGGAVDTFYVGITTAENVTVTTYFKKDKLPGFDIAQTVYNGKRFYSGMPENMLQAILSENVNPTMFEPLQTLSGVSIDFGLAKTRGFLYPYIHAEGIIVYSGLIDTTKITGLIAHLIHLPGLRGSPERDYSDTTTGPAFPGTFEPYVASIIEQWQLDNEKQKLERLFSDLARLALTNKVVARRRNDTAIELLVNRFMRGDREDMVSIADVGLGVSQALPVVVALHTANPGQLVYIEQPEIHLHPRAQVAMAEVLADAAKEGKRLVIETHSSLLLLGIQTLVAEGKLPPELVKLHWFTLDDDGSTNIDTADLDARGAYGDWAEDFGDVELHSEARFLDAQALKRERAGE
jgi:hypothetical protein